MFNRIIHGNFNSSYLVVLLILAGDTELNPGPRPLKYPCLICKKAAKWGQDCLQCDQCDGWYHVNCMVMSPEVYDACANTSLTWICCECGLPNISPSLFNSFNEGIPLSNSFDFLTDTANDVQSPDPGTPLASSSPNPSSKQTAAERPHKQHHNNKLKAIVVNFDGVYSEKPQLNTS